LKISNTGKEGEDSATDLIMNGSKTMIQLITDIHTIDVSSSKVMVNLA
jgi:hypothetical protein